MFLLLECLYFLVAKVAFFANNNKKVAFFLKIYFLKNYLLFL